MGDWLSTLRRKAELRERAGLRRELRPREVGDTMTDLAGNDYLGLSRHPEVIAAATRALTEYGLGATGSRLVRGSTDAHTALEDALAHRLGSDRALVYSSGYLANLGVVRALAHEPGLGATFLSTLDNATHKASAMLIGGAVDGLRAARFALNDALPAAAADPRGEQVLAGARQMALTMGYALALAQLVGIDGRHVGRHRRHAAGALARHVHRVQRRGRERHPGRRLGLAEQRPAGLRGRVAVQVTAIDAQRQRLKLLRRGGRGRRQAQRDRQGESRERRATQRPTRATPWCRNPVDGRAPGHTTDREMPALTLRDWTRCRATTR